MKARKQGFAEALQALQSLADLHIACRSPSFSLRSTTDWKISCWQQENLCGIWGLHKHGAPHPFFVQLCLYSPIASAGLTLFLFLAVLRPQRSTQQLYILAHTSKPFQSRPIAQFQNLIYIYSHVLKYFSLTYINYTYYFVSLYLHNTQNTFGLHLPLTTSLAPLSLLPIPFFPTTPSSTFLWLKSCIGVIYRAMGPVPVATPLKKTSPSLCSVITGYKSAGRHETPWTPTSMAWS